MLKVFFVATFWLFCSLSCAEAEKDPYKFVSNLYEKYQADSQNFAFNGPIADSIFAPALLGLIRLDQKLAQGETGYINWNPLCDCQDNGGMKIISITVYKKKSKTYAEVKLDFSLEKRTIVLQLAKIKRRWLISDFETPETPSLCKYLSEKLRKDIQ